MFQHEVTGVLAATFIAAVASTACTPEPTREEVVAKHRAAIEAKVEAVKAAAKAIAATKGPPTGSYSLPEKVVFLEYRSNDVPAPVGNAAWAYEQDLIDLARPGDLSERLRIPYSSLFTECADAVEGRSTSHPGYLEQILADCEAAKFLFAIRIDEHAVPVANPDGETFTPGFLDTTVFAVDLADPTKVAGSFAVRVESSSTAFAQSDNRGPEGALMSSFASAVETAAEQAQKQ